MRWSILATSVVLLVPGCILEPGLESSTTKCPASTPLVDGFKLQVEQPGRLAGHCVAIAHDDASVDDPFALRRLGADGVAYLPVEGAGEYSLSVAVVNEDDKYCATQIHEFAQHPGTGLLTVAGNVTGVCA